MKKMHSFFFFCELRTNGVFSWVTSRQCCKTFALLRPLAASTPTAFCALHGRGAEASYGGCTAERASFLLEATSFCEMSMAVPAVFQSRPRLQFRGSNN